MAPELFICSYDLLDTRRGLWKGLPVMLSAHPGALPGTSTHRVSGCLVPVSSICYSFLSRGFLSRCHFSHSSGNIHQTTELKCQLDFGSLFHSKKIYKDN